MVEDDDFVGDDENLGSRLQDEGDGSGIHIEMGCADDCAVVFTTDPRLLVYSNSTTRRHLEERAGIPPPRSCQPTRGIVWVGGNLASA